MPPGRIHKSFQVIVSKSGQRLRYIQKETVITNQNLHFGLRSDGDVLAAKFFGADSQRAVHETKMLQALAGTDYIVKMRGAYTSAVDSGLHGNFTSLKRPRARGASKVAPEPETSLDISPLHFILQEMCECTLQCLIKSRSQFSEAPALKRAAAQLFMVVEASRSKGGK